jgi:hypothetical protein
VYSSLKPWYDYLNSRARNGEIMSDSTQLGFIELDGSDWRDEGVVFDGHTGIQTAVPGISPADLVTVKLLTVKSADGVADLPVIRVTGTASQLLAWLLDNWTGGGLQAALDCLSDGEFQPVDAA